MRLPERVVACVTTRNEAETIGFLIRGLQTVDVHRVIVVDAASEDGTVAAAADAGAVAVASSKRLPIATALMRAWHMALAADATAVLQIDAGGSHDPLEAPRLLHRLEYADMVIGSRFTTGADYLGGTLRRRLGSRIAAWMCSAVQGERLTDWTSGYRAFRSSVVRDLLRFQYQAVMHGWQIETLVRALDLNYYVAEAPITYRAGRSSFNRRIAGEALEVWLWMCNDHARPAPAGVGDGR